jgi:hypothetical protein
MTSSLQISAYYRSNPHFGGVMSKSRVANLSPRGKFYVLNLEDAEDAAGRPLPGTHWVVVYDCGPRCLYIDPYGLSPPDIIAAFVSRSASSLPSQYSTDDYQSLTSSQCAEFCLYVIDCLERGLTFDALDATLTSGPSAHNERTVDVATLRNGWR